ncbi:MAG: cell wall hydrolase [Lachnospiraceae bacterium]
MKLKKHLLIKIMCFIIGGSLLGGLVCNSAFPVSAVSEKTQNEIDKTEKEKEKLEQELEEQQENKEKLENEKEKEEGTLEELKVQYQKLSSDITALQEEAEHKEQEISLKTKELEAAQARQEKQYADMKMRIQYLYEQPEETLFSMIFHNFEIADVVSRIEYTLQLQEYDRNQLKKYQQEKEKIGQQKAELEAAKQELDGLIKEAAAKQQQVSELQRRTGDRISAYLDDIVRAEAGIKSTEEILKQKAEALNKLYEQARLEEAAERRRKAEEAALRLQEGIENGTINVEDSGIVYGEVNLTQDEMDMLTAMIYCESRGEPYEGQLAVGYVIMNRLRSTKFPNTLEEVLRQSKQFEPAGSGRFDIVLQAYRENIPGVLSEREWNSCRSAAEACVNSQSSVGECLFFRTHAPVPQLAENLEAAGVPYWIIQNHIFYYSWVSY